MSPGGQRPVVVVHAGAGARGPASEVQDDRYRSALLATLERAQAILEAGESALEAVQAAVMHMEDAVDFFNAGRGSVLCADGSVEMAAAVMRGSDRAAGAVAAVSRTRYPIVAARAVLDHSPHVLLVGAAADAHATRAGADQREPSYFVTDRQRRRLAAAGANLERGTVGAVCLDVRGELAAATSTGGIRGQTPGRVGDSPLIGAGTWADARVAVSCTGDGEAFIRAGAARQLAAEVQAGRGLRPAADEALADVAAVGGRGGLIAVDRQGNAATPFTAAAMPRGIWRGGEMPTVWVA